MASAPRYSDALNARIYEAHELAGSRGESHSDVTHLLQALLAPAGGELISHLTTRGNDIDELRSAAAKALPRVRGSALLGASKWQSEEAIQVTQGFMDVLGAAEKLAARAGEGEVDEIRVFEALRNGGDSRLEGVLATVEVGEDSEAAAARPSALKKLTRYGRILTDEAADGALDPVIGRERETQRLMHILGRRRKNNPVLLGDPGVGKTAIVEGLAQAIVAGLVPSSIAGRHIFALDIGSLVAGTKYRGEFESRIQELLDSIRASEGGIIMFVDEMHLIANAGGAEGAIDAAGFLKPMLARGEIRVIGATTVADYREGVVGDGALERRFQPIYVREPTPAETMDMLRGLRPRYEAHHGIPITDEAIETAIRASQEKIPYRKLPDKAIDLVDEAASRMRALLEMTEASEPGEVGPTEVLSVLDDWVGEAGSSWGHEVYGELHQEHD